MTNKRKRNILDAFVAKVDENLRDGDKKTKARTMKLLRELAKGHIEDIAAGINLAKDSPQTR